MIANRVVIRRFQAGRFRLTRANLLAAANEAIESGEEIKAYEQGMTTLQGIGIVQEEEKQEE